MGKGMRKVRIKISTKLLAYFLFVTILPLSFLALTSSVLISSSLNSKLTQELDSYSRYSQKVYEKIISGFKSTLNNINPEKLGNILSENNYSKEKLSRELKETAQNNDFQAIMLLDKHAKVISSYVDPGIMKNIEVVESSTLNLKTLIDEGNKSGIIISSELISLKDLLELGVIKNDRLNNYYNRQLGLLFQSGLVRFYVENNSYYLFLAHQVNKNSQYYKPLNTIYGSKIVIASNNRVIFSNSKDNISSIAFVEEQPLLKFISSSGNKFIINGKSYRSSVIKLKNISGKNAGELITGIPEEDFDNLKYENSLLIFEIALGVALVGITFAYLLARTITNPLSKVIEAAGAIENGDLTHRVDIKSTDELSYLAQSFNSMAEALQKRKELEQLRDDLVATLTHDLRVPLLAEVQTLECMLKGSYGKLNEKQNFITEQLISNNKNLLDMVNTILDSYKYEAGKQTLIKKKVNFNKLIEECMLDLKSLYEKKNLEVSFTADNEKTETIVDRQEIKRVIINLLGNAIAYTMDGGKIEIFIVEKEDQVIVRVKDTGIGISEDMMKNLFKKYSKGNKTLRKIGTGLGLYLSKYIVDAHGGKIWVESKENQGSSFYFSLPALTNREN